MDIRQAISVELGCRDRSHVVAYWREAQRIDQRGYSGSSAEEQDRAGISQEHDIVGAIPIEIQLDAVWGERLSTAFERLVPCQLPQLRTHARPEVLHSAGR